MSTKLSIPRLALVFALSLLFAFALTPVQAQDSDVSEGNALFDAGDYEAAYAPLRRAAFANPFDTPTLGRYLFSLVYAGHFADIEFPANLLSSQNPEALSQLGATAAQLAQSAPDDVRLAQVAAYFAVDSGDPAQAEAIDRVLTLDPESAFGYDLQAYAAFYSGDAEGGREAAERALALAPGDPHIIVDLALPFAWALNDPDRALELLTQAITLDPSIGEAYADRATIYSNFLGDASAALPDFDRAIELDPRNFVYFTGRGFAYVGLEDYALAQSDFETVIELYSPSLGAMVGLVNTAIAAGTSIDDPLAQRDLVEADTVLTVAAPYSGEMTGNRVVRLPLNAEPSEYILTVKATDLMTLDTLLILANGDSVPLAFNDDIDGQGARADGAYNSQITWTVEAGVTYLAYILHSGAGSEGAFTVTLEAAG